MSTKKNKNRDYHYWQVYTDQIVIAVLLALPWTIKGNKKDEKVIIRALVIQKKFIRQMEIIKKKTQL